MANYRNGTDGHMKGDYSYNGRRRRPKMGTGMAEKAAQDVEGYQSRMKRRMRNIPKTEW